MSETESLEEAWEGLRTEIMFGPQEGGWKNQARALALASFGLGLSAGRKGGVGRLRRRIEELGK